MSEEPKTVRLPIMVTESEARDIEHWQQNRQVGSRAEAIRQLMRAGLELPLLCIDLLDGLEVMGVLDHPQIKKEIDALESYLGTSRQEDYADQYSSHRDLKPENLTRREEQVFQMIAHGQKNQEIAEKLEISPSTVKLYVRSILSKLKMSRRDQISERSFRLMAEKDTRDIW